MQDNTVKAFRQRLVRHSFTNISIDNLYDGTYLVCCSKDGVDYRRKMTLSQMWCTPRLVWFD